MAAAPDPLISTAELAGAYADPSLCVVDGSWFLPGQGDAAAGFAAAHLPGAVRFDIDAASDPATDLPHMLAAPEAFAAYMGAVGVADDARLVIYDQQGLFSAARVWWNLRAMGARDVRVLDGGLPRWRAEGRPLERGPAADRPAARFTPRRDRDRVVDLAALRARLAQGGQVADARPADRFRGEAAEPRPGLARGHMPGARSLPLSALLADGALKPVGELRAAFADAGVDPDAPLTATCGSGVTAAAIALAQARLGRDDAAVYDGAWAEWGARLDLPVATGPAATGPAEAGGWA